MKKLIHIIAVVVINLVSLAVTAETEQAEVSEKMAAEKAALASVSGIVVSHQVWWGVEEVSGEEYNHAGRWIHSWYVYETRTQQLLPLKYSTAPATVIITEAHVDSWQAPAPVLPDDDNNLMDFLTAENVKAAIRARSADTKWKRLRKPGEPYYYWLGSDYRIHWRLPVPQPKG